jgi:hypothetical protein
VYLADAQRRPILDGDGEWNDCRDRPNRRIRAPESLAILLARRQRCTFSPAARPGFPALGPRVPHRSTDPMKAERERARSIPFVLRHLTALPAAPAPGPAQEYDPLRQLWISVESGRPLVIEHAEERATARAIRNSQFGETVMTKTQEGTDQTEAADASRFGETSNTRTAEGTDRSEVSASKFGETVITSTSEGHDQSECARTASHFGETILSESREGVDQSENVQPASKFGETMQTATGEGTDQREAAS